MKGRQAFKSALWSTFENLSLAVLSVVTLVVYARFLTITDFGIFSTILAFSEIVSVFITMMFHDALIQRRHISRNHSDTAFTVTLVASLIVAAACIIFRNQIISIINAPNTELELIILSLSVVANAASSSIIALQKRSLDFRPIAIRSLVGRISGAFVGLYLVLTDHGVLGLAAQQFVMASMSSATLWVMSKNRPRIDMQLSGIKDLWEFASISVLNQLLGFMIKRIFFVSVGVQLGAEQAGILNLAFRTVDVFWTLILSAAQQVALPLFAGVENNSQLSQIYKDVSKMSCYIVMPAFVGIAIVSDLLVSLVYGVRWISASPYVSALAILVCLQSTRLYFSSIIISRGRPVYVLIGLVLEFLFVTSIIFTVGLSSIGQAVAVWIAREVISTPLMSILLTRAARVTVYQQLSPLFLPSSVAAGLALFLIYFRLELAPFFESVVLNIIFLGLCGILFVCLFVVAFDRKFLQRFLRIAVRPKFKA